MQLGVSEILKKASDIPDDLNRIIFLRQNAIKPVQMVIQYALDPNIEWLLPDGLPEFNPNRVNEGAEVMLLAEARRLYLFVKGGNDALEQRKREILFIQFLEMLCPDDIKLIAHIKDHKELPYPNLGYDLIKKAFPDLLPDKEIDAPMTKEELKKLKPMSKEKRERIKAATKPVVEKKETKRGTKKVKTA